MPQYLTESVVLSSPTYELRKEHSSSYVSKKANNGDCYAVYNNNYEYREIFPIRYGSLPSNAIPVELTIQMYFQCTSSYMDSYEYAWYWTNLDPTTYKDQNGETLWNSATNYACYFVVTPSNPGSSNNESGYRTIKITNFPSNFINESGKYVLMSRIASYTKSFETSMAACAVMYRDDYSYTMTLKYYLNSPPNKPVSQNVVTSSKNPSLTFTLSDPDDNVLKKLQVQVSRSSSFTSGNIVWDNTTSFTVSSGSNRSITVGTSLNPGTYYFRAKVMDSNNTWSDWSNTYTITVNSYPSTTILNTTSFGYTLNQRPAIFVKPVDSDGDNITDLHTQISTSSSFSSLAWEGYASSGGIQGLPVSSGTVVKVSPSTNLSPGTYYVRVRAKDQFGWGAYSPTVTFTVASAPWSDTIPPDATAFKAEWMNQIAEGINAVRQFRGLPTVEFTDGTIIPQQHDIKAIHVAERRSALEEVLGIVGITPAWTDPDLSSADRKGIHIQELRNYLLQA